MTDVHIGRAHYRAEIDGLRAIAVLSVIFFHAGVRSFRGGYVGVDVFFVISGYLITSILITELQTGKLSLSGFYERRARRILPTLVVVSIACLPFAWVWMFPDELRRFGESLSSVATFSSNFFFWLKTNYFSPSAEEQPLIHTWSLAVEEQYYLAFPVFLWLVWRFGKRAVVLLVLSIAAISLLYCEWASRHFSAANFYLLPSRVWELFAGVLIAFYDQRSTETNAASTMPGWWRSCASWAGLGLLACGIWGAYPQTLGPSLTTLIPIVGTALIIAFARGESGVRRVLSWRPLVVIGLISYSLYLWHQPVLAFARLVGVHEGSAVSLALTLLATFTLAYLSWRFVEQPFRRRNFLSRRTVLCASGATLCLCFAVGFLLHSKHGFPERTVFVGNANVANYLAVKTQRDSWEKWCETHAVPGPFRHPICKVGDPNVPPRLIVWGDSSAGALLQGLEAELKNIGQSLYIFEADSCPPIPGLSMTGEDECAPETHMDFVDHVGALPDVRNVIWYGNVQGGMVNDTMRLGGVRSSAGAVRNAIADAVTRLQQLHKEVVFLEQGPYMWTSAPDFYIRAELRHSHEELGMSRDTYDAFMAPVEQLRPLFKDPSGHYVDTDDVFCVHDFCPARRTEWGLTYSDNGHVSLPVARILARAALSRFSKDSWSPGEPAKPQLDLPADAPSHEARPSAQPPRSQTAL